MPLEYTNRKGDRYYVHQGLTKTGKTTYHCSRKPGGTPVDKLPAEFEVFEHPQSAIVSIRKVKPTRLTSTEFEFVKHQVHAHSGGEHAIFDWSGDSFTIYMCDLSFEEADLVIDRLQSVFSRHGAASNRDWLLKTSNYSPAFRLTLVDEPHRLFTIERWCFRGAIDDWIILRDRPQQLKELADIYFQHVGQESFYDLI